MKSLVILVPVFIAVAAAGNVGPRDYNPRANTDFDLDESLARERRSNEDRPASTSEKPGDKDDVKIEGNSLGYYGGYGMGGYGMGGYGMGGYGMGGYGYPYYGSYYGRR